MSQESLIKKYDHVAVLLGGWSAEREISLRSGNACAAALEKRGYKVTRIDVDRNIATKLAQLKPGVCFNALHGRWGEDGCIQGILECLAIPYTHSGVLSSALAMHKEQARRVMAAAGIPVAEGGTVSRDDAAKQHAMTPPYVAKPIAEGSSVGIVIVQDAGSAPPAAIARVPDLNGEILIEKFVPGRELTCGVIGDRVTEVIDIVPDQKSAFYDFDAKYAPGGSRHILPAELPPSVADRVRELTLKAHRALECRGVSRADFRFDDTPGGSGALICMEVNTQPGMTATSLVPELAAHAGLSFEDLVAWIVEDASLER